MMVSWPLNKGVCNFSGVFFYSAVIVKLGTLPVPSIALMHFNISVYVFIFYD